MQEEQCYFGTGIRADTEGVSKGGLDGKVQEQEAVINNPGKRYLLPNKDLMIAYLRR